MIEYIDHFVLTVKDIEASLSFYMRVFNMRAQRFGTPDKPRVALAFAQQKINLHPLHAVPDPNVLKPTPGTGDFCLIASIPLDDLISHLVREQVPIVEGPVCRTGAMGPIRSVYVRDPDLNLIEIAEYLHQ